MKRVLVLAMAAFCVSAAAQAPSTDDLQKRLDAAKQAEAVKKAAAKKKEDAVKQAEEDRRRAEAVVASEVWANPDSHAYHCRGDEWYGKTKNGSYMSEAAAISAGYHGSHDRKCRSD